MPTYTVVPQASGMYITATNPENRTYTAIINFDWTHNSFGQIKQERVSTTSNVAANLNNGNIFQLTGAYVNFQIVGGVAGVSVQFS